MAARGEAKPVPIQPVGIDGDDELSAIQAGPPLPQGGSCLFTAGAVGSGKSTLQHALIHSLYRDERIDFSFRNEDGEALHDPDLQEWIFQFDRGEFPERTPRSRLQTFFVQFGQRGRPVKLSFAEISGEHFQAILPRSGQPELSPNLAPDLEHILTTRDVKKLFLFIADTTRHDPGREQSTDDRDQALFEDMLFFALLGRIRELGLSRIRLLFAAAKWDEAPNRNLDPERCFRAHFPQTRSALRRFPKAQVQYIRFSVGDVRKVEGGSGVKIAKHDSAPIERVIQWIHTHAADRALRGYPAIRPTLWDRIKGWAAT